LERFAAETRRAELAHWLILAASPWFFLWNPWWLGLAMGRVRDRRERAVHRDPAIQPGPPFAYDPAALGGKDGVIVGRPHDV
jgi:Glycosyl-4,4'-diaponeurosporenoate acyltransferase